MSETDDLDVIREQRIGEVLNIIEEIKEIRTELAELYGVEVDGGKMGKISVERSSIMSRITVDVDSATDDKGKKLYTNQKRRDEEIRYRINHNERIILLNSQSDELRLRPKAERNRMENLDRRLECLSSKREILLLALRGSWGDEYGHPMSRHLILHLSEKNLHEIAKIEQGADRRREKELEEYLKITEKIFEIGEEMEKLESDTEEEDDIYRQIEDVKYRIQRDVDEERNSDGFLAFSNQEKRDNEILHREIASKELKLGFIRN